MALVGAYQEVTWVIRYSRSVIVDGRLKDGGWSIGRGGGSSVISRNGGGGFLERRTEDEGETLLVIFGDDGA